MKRKFVSVLMLAAVMSTTVTGASAVLAEETSTEAAVTEAPAEAAAEAEAEDTQQEEKVIEDVKITLESGEVTIKNGTEMNFISAEYKKKEAAQDESDANAQESASEEVWNLLLTDEEGNVHTFENVTPDQWTEPSVTEEYGFLYITYKDAYNKEQEALETGEEKAFEQEVTVYATTDVNVRETASTEAKSLKVTSLGAEWKAVATVPGWIRVEGDGVSGYIFHSYVTEDKEKVDALVQEKKAADEAAAQARAAAQAQAAQEQTYYEEPVYQEPAPQEPAAQEPEQPSEPVEVSRQAYDDCDGSGHGYYEITYSDGSIVFEEY